jgi:hypothetical protein
MGKHFQCKQLALRWKPRCELEELVYMQLELLLQLFFEQELVFICLLLFYPFKQNEFH